MLIGKLLAKRPEDRFQSMKEVEAALETYATKVRPTLDSTPIVRIDDIVPTVGLPRAAAVVALPAARSRPQHAWLGLAVAGLGAGIALLVLRGRPPAVIPPNTAPLQADATGSARHRCRDPRRRAARRRVRPVPQLRAAVETDAATVKDMLHGDFVVNQGKDEVFELFQRKDGKVLPLYVKPEGPPLMIPDGPRLHNVGPGLDVCVSTRVGEHGGIALLMPVDLAANHHRARHPRNHRRAARPARAGVAREGHRRRGARGPPRRGDARARGVL